MTLLDATIALVILGLAAVGFLGAFQSSTRSAQLAAEWVQAVGYAEATMEESKVGGATSANDTLPAGFTRSIRTQPWAGALGLEEVTVTISTPRGATFTLRRLARTP